MPTSNPLLKTRQVADALGVSASTVKRWVDSEVIAAGRTQGRHRLVPLSEVVRFARERRFPQASLDRLATLAAVEAPARLAVVREPAPAELTSPLPTIEPIEAQVELLIRLLLAGNARGARDRIRSAYESGLNAGEIADDLIRPAMQWIGHGWQTGDLDVYQEHQASHIIGTALIDLIRRVSAEREMIADRPLALGATLEGDLYSLPGLVCELTLTEAGWDVVNLGPNLPLRSLARAVRQKRPRLVWISISHVADPDLLVRRYAAFRDVAADCGASVILGGHALSQELRSRLPCEGYGDRMSDLARFARSLDPRPDRIGGSSRRDERPSSTHA